MISRYKIYPEQGLLVEQLLADLDFSELIYIFTKEYRDKDFVHVKKILGITLGTKTKMQISDVSEYIENLKKVFMKRELRWAIVVDEPLLVAFASLVEYNEFFKYRIRVFSTIEAAIRFLNVRFSESDLDSDGFIPVHRDT
jgi:hypothetical protein